MFAGGDQEFKAGCTEEPVLNVGHTRRHECKRERTRSRGVTEKRSARRAD